MRNGRPRTPIGGHGAIHVTRTRGRYLAATRVRDLDGRLRRVTAVGPNRSSAGRALQERLAARPSFGAIGVLTTQSRFSELADLWLADLDLAELSENTKKNYRDDLRRHLLPAFENYTLAEITTGRLDWFLKAEARVSYSRAKHSKTLLSLLFAFALRHDAIPRNPIQGTTTLRKPKPQPMALSLEQVAAIRAGAAAWRTGPDVKGPKPDGKVRDILEVLLGSALRIGEVLALRVCDLTDTRAGMVASISGTVVMRTGQGAVRQDHPKTEASIRRIGLPEFAAAVLRRRIVQLGPGDPTRTVFGNRDGRPLSPHNVRRTFREVLEIAGLADTEITLRWYRRTGATVIARGAGKEAAAGYLGHTSSVISETHYIEPDPTVDMSLAALIERTLRPVDPEVTLLATPPTDEEARLLESVDGIPDEARRSAAAKAA